MHNDEHEARQFHVLNVTLSRGHSKEHAGVASFIGRGWQRTIWFAR